MPPFEQATEELATLRLSSSLPCCLREAEISLHAYPTATLVSSNFPSPQADFRLQPAVAQPG